MRVCETVLGLAVADWVHETMEGCPGTGCPFVGEVEGEGVAVDVDELVDHPR